MTDRRSKLAVLKLVAKGKSNAEIAVELYLSEPTVNTYVSVSLPAGPERPRAAGRTG
jgi:DNA-binding NarL/FixJ family response regulator